MSQSEIIDLLTPPGSPPTLLAPTTPPRHYREYTSSLVVEEAEEESDSESEENESGELAAIEQDEAENHADFISYTPEEEIQIEPLDESDKKLKKIEKELKRKRDDRIILEAAEIIKKREEKILKKMKKIEKEK